MNTIDYTNQVMTVNSVSENTTGSNAITASAINSSLLTDGKVDVSKLMLEIQKLLGKMVRILQDYQQQQLSQSYQIQLAVFESQNKAIDEKKAAATAALVGGAISSVLGILGSFAAINSATKGASDIAQKTASTSSKAIDAASDTATKTLTKATESVADDIADSAQRASQLAENAADAAQKASRASRFMAAVDKITGSTPFIAVTSLAEGTKTLPTTVSESVKANHEISEQRYKSVENFQQGNLELYKQEVRRAQDDIASRLRDMTTAARDLTDLQNRMGQSVRLAG
ncbi:type III secretion system LEE translocon pore-forming subunit EspB [Escherichia coli]|nr:eaeB [Escherichia coli]EHW3388833.1 type III secretion system LEE translocon pore-forming subunit EspB [Escherichia coli]EIC1513785.1 type III secretion system LEE translocon pore-forming subunit EspB [Escherichia coli]EKD0791640.1 type III secretion system LEE translocon pore-forming subunit EspB [Escherichia coli]